MYRKCIHCRFGNPPDIDTCLVCNKTLPTTIVEAREGVQKLVDLVQGNVDKVGEHVVTDIVQEHVSSLKYRFNPLWFVRVQLHKLKMRFESVIWVFVIMIGLVVVGIIINFFSKLFK